MHQYPNTQMCNSEKRCSVKSLKFSSCFCYLVATWMVVTCELAVVVDVALMRCSVLLVEDLLVVDVICDMMMLLNCQQATADTASYKSQASKFQKSGITISPEWSVFNRFLLASIRRKIPAHTHIRGAHQMSHTHN